MNTQVSSANFDFHQRHNNLAFWPIVHVLAVALADGAFKDDAVHKPEDLYDFNPQQNRVLSSIPIEWKDEFMECLSCVAPRRMWTN